ncbi:MAG: GntR family transcriptional regulator [Oscillospiraceae bacterium]|nr:GntR family transcriptional regulator [Oscillospiraceae bacterium]
MPWSFDSSTPLYLQIMEQIKFRIAVGDYKAGDKLASVRELAAEAEVNPNTMQKALSELEREGLLFTQRTSGRFVTENSESITSLRRGLANTQLDLFLKKMYNLGYDNEEVVKLLQDYIGQEEQA